MKTIVSACYRRSPQTFALLVLLSFGIVDCARAQQADPFPLTAENLRLDPDVGINLSRAGWRYRSGDDALWAAPDHDDSEWERLPRTRVAPDALPRDGWNGRAWFRLRVRVDDALADRPLALRVWQRGASEIYIDGKLAGGFGKIDAGTDEESNPLGLFVPIVLDSGAHTIAVRYSYLAAGDMTRGRGAWLARANQTPYIALAVMPVQDAARQLYDHAREDYPEYLLAGLLVALALVHLLLYVFYRAERGNLFYCFFAAGLALTILLSRAQFGGHYGSVATVLLDIARQTTQATALMSLLAFLYVEFTNRVSRFYYVLLALWLVVMLSHAAQVTLSAFQSFVLVMLLVTLAACLVIVVRALARRQDGAWIIAAGVITLALSVLSNVGIERGFVALPEWMSKLRFQVTILSVPLAVSIYLARNFARTNRDLAARLTQVQELSAREIEHERTTTELKLQHERERAENERRAQELEEARVLQLSMLPKQVPQLARFDIAAYMKPASEVGGDYYDFHVAADETLTVVVGDATGHGLKAGTVVTATKSLFNAFATEADVTAFFRRSSLALKGMNLRGLYMALAMIKVRGDAVTLCAAGMPPVLVYRRATNQVEEILVKGMPLGSITGYAYKEQRFDLTAGDAVVLMSDGFPERFDAGGEMLGYERARAVLAEVAHKTATEIVERFVSEGDEWAGAKAQDDDVTFVVLKVSG